jgi:Protein of unknown function (DUF1552)
MKSDPDAGTRFAIASSVTRRRFLHGLGTCLALPAFESLIRSRAEAAELVAPRRIAFVTIPNGVNQKGWWPSGDGTDFQLSPTMKPLEKVQKHIQIIHGLDHLNATPGPDGPGDHARANATLLTGVRAKKTAGNDIRLGISIDQVAAKHIGHLTRFPSIELTCDKIRKSGLCDSGYSCAYLYNIAWQSDTTPMTPEANPRLVFERLFGSGPPGERAQTFEQQRHKQRSVLDFVRSEAGLLQRQLSPRDQMKLDEYLTGVRELEKRIARAQPIHEPSETLVQTPAGIPSDYGEHMQLMFDLLVLAFQTDSTRIATLLLAGDGTNYTFPQIGIPEGHHYLTHNQHKADDADKVQRIDAYYMAQFARFLEKLDQTHDADGNSLLYNSMILYTGGIADGNAHTHANLPAILAGSGGGTLNSGRYFKVASSPMSNLFLSMIDRLGVSDVESFGDSTGRIDAI